MKFRATGKRGDAPAVASCVGTLVSESQRLSVSDPKLAFRAAESLLAEAAFFPEEKFLQDALSKVAAALGPRDCPSTYIVYRRTAAALQSLDDTASLAPGERLSSEEADAMRRAPSSYPAEPNSVGLWNLGLKRQWIVRWSFASPLGASDIVGLEAARLVISQKLAEASLTGILHQAAAIQSSLLPDPVPVLPAIDAAARSLAAESVGGDVYDVTELAPDALGFAIADASGHGLPAALQARDVVVGLRMGAARHMKINATVGRLNEILCRSTLSSRFVSLIYGELDADGTFQFVNAGHPYPILVNPERTSVIADSDIVLGVSGNSRFRTIHGVIEPGGLLLLVTDGILEAKSPGGEEFGIDRLVALARQISGRHADEIVGATFEEVERHTRRRTPTDDATVVAFRRLS